MAVHHLDPFNLVSLIYQYLQYVISFLFSPLPPSSRKSYRPLAHVAVIGAGVSGISTAAHLVGHGFQVTIFDEAEKVGGIWSRVNRTSGLQISSLMYRFFPSVLYTRGYPKRDEIVDNIESIWKRYGLEERTRLGFKVESVTRHSSSTDPKKGGHGRWIINNDDSQVYDAVVATVGTCGKPKKMELPSESSFKGKIHHSSELDDLDLKGKKVLIVGGGASGIEALELAVEKGADCPTIIARSDKWIIPRFTLVDILLSLQPFGRETYLSFIPEFLIRKLHYKDLEDKMSPTQGFYQGTPIVNSSALDHIRKGKADYRRGDLTDLTENGIMFSDRKKGQEKGKGSKPAEIKADIIVVATGFERPSVDFLPKDLFPGEYVRPNMYLQNFPVTDCSVLCTNSTFRDAVGTVGSWHIGIYARILMVFLLDPATRPTPKRQRLWVDVLGFLKEGAPGGALEFFTYMELCVWLVTFCFFKFARMKYFFFVLLGWGYWTREAPVKEGGKKNARGRAPEADLPASFHLSTSKVLPHYRRKTSKKSHNEEKIGGTAPAREVERPSKQHSSRQEA